MPPGSREVSLTLRAGLACIGFWSHARNASHTLVLFRFILKDLDTVEEALDVFYRDFYSIWITKDSVCCPYFKVSSVNVYRFSIRQPSLLESILSIGQSKCLATKPLRTRRYPRAAGKVCLIS